jgi:hypothetical protein
MRRRAKYCARRQYRSGARTARTPTTNTPRGPGGRGGGGGSGAGGGEAGFSPSSSGGAAGSTGSSDATSAGGSATPSDPFDSVMGTDRRPGPTTTMSSSRDASRGRGAVHDTSRTCTPARVSRSIPDRSLSASGRGPRATTATVRLGPELRSAMQPPRRRVCGLDRRAAARSSPCTQARSGRSASDLWAAVAGSRRGRTVPSVSTPAGCRASGVSCPLGGARRRLGGRDA